MKQNSIPARELGFLIHSGAAGSFLFMTYYIINSAGRSSYIATLCGSLVTAVFLFWLIQIANKMSGLSLIQILYNTYGKIVSTGLILLYSLFHIVTASFILRLSLTLFVKTILLPHFPLWLIALLPILIIGAFLYMDNFSIFSQWNLILIVVTLLAYFGGMIIGVVTKFDFDNLKPVFHVKLYDFAYGAFLMTSVTSETVIKAFSIIGMIKSKKSTYRGYYIGCILFIPLMSLSLFFALSIMGLGVAKNSIFSVIDLAQEIGAETYIQGFEIFHLIPFLSLIYINVGYKSYCSLLGITTLSKNKKLKKIFVLVICGSIYTLTLLMPSFNKAMVYLNYIVNYITIPLCLFFLILATIAVVIQKRRKKKSS